MRCRRGSGCSPFSLIDLGGSRERTGGADQMAAAAPI
jgi:hypothetical protein